MNYKTIAYSTALIINGLLFIYFYQVARRDLSKMAIDQKMRSELRSTWKYPVLKTTGYIFGWFKVRKDPMKAAEVAVNMPNNIRWIFRLGVLSILSGSLIIIIHYIQKRRRGNKEVNLIKKSPSSNF